MSKRKDLLLLLRPALAPTAAADVVVGAAFGRDAAPLRLAAAAAGGALLYMGGMVLNDLADRKRDAPTHPDRPLVRRPELVRVARLLAVGLFCGGLVLAWAAGALWPALCATVLAAGYDLGWKRIFPFDVLSMGGARAANLTIGLVVAAAPFDATSVTLVLAYLLYIASVTAASRAEDLEPPQTRRLALLLSFLPQVLSLGGFASLAKGAYHFSFLAPFFVLLIVWLRAMAAGSRRGAETFVFFSLLTIYLIDAALLWGRGRSGSLAVLLLLAATTFFLLATTRRKAEPSSAAPAS